jgi:2-amino-4-hydroxy-6-hydroxymethyldihydropteridine diphosphokinase
MEALIALGSNIDAAHNLPKAMRHVAGLAEPLAQSSSWRTAPHGPVEGGEFLNAVQHVKWHGDLPALQAALKRIEAGMGRQPDTTWKARPIDLDVVAVREHRKAWVLLDEGLAEKPFLLRPLAEVAPNLRVGKVPVEELARRLGPDGAQLVHPRTR